MNELLEEQDGDSAPQYLEDAPIDLSGFEVAKSNSSDPDSDPDSENQEPQVRSLARGPRQEVTEADKLAARERLLGSKLPPEKVKENESAPADLGTGRQDSEDDFEIELEDLGDLGSDPQVSQEIRTEISQYVESHPPAKPSAPQAIKRSASATPPRTESQMSAQEELALSNEMEDLLKFLGESAPKDKVLPVAVESLRIIEVEAEAPELQESEEVLSEEGAEMSDYLFFAPICKAPAPGGCFSDFYVLGGSILPDPHTGLKKVISWDSDVPDPVRNAIQSLRGAGVICDAPKFLPTERKNSTLCYPAPAVEGQPRFSYFLASASPVYIPGALSAIPGVPAYAERFLLVAATENPNEKTLTILYNFQGIEKDSLTILGAEQ